MTNPSLGEVRRWVWTRLVRRAGRVSNSVLHAAWDKAPSLLEDALRGLRDDGWIGCANGVWYIRTWEQPMRLPEGPPGL